MGTVEGLRGGSFFKWARRGPFYPLAPAVAVPASAITLCQMPRDDHHSSLQGDSRIQVLLEHRSCAWTHCGCGDSQAQRECPLKRLCLFPCLTRGPRSSSAAAAALPGLPPLIAVCPIHSIFNSPAQPRMPELIQRRT